MVPGERTGWRSSTEEKRKGKKKEHKNGSL